MIELYWNDRGGRRPVKREWMVAWSKVMKNMGRKILVQEKLRK